MGGGRSMPARAEGETSARLGLSLEPLADRETSPGVNEQAADTPILTNPEKLVGAQHNRLGLGRHGGMAVDIIPHLLGSSLGHGYWMQGGEGTIQLMDKAKPPGVGRVVYGARFESVWE